MKKILVPMDFSEQAFNAMDMATAIAKKSNSEILLSYIIEIPNRSVTEKFRGTDDEKKCLEMLKTSFAKKLEEVCTNKKYGGVKIKSEVKTGSAYLNLTKLISHNKIDLVIMGSAGVTSPKELLLGSTVQRMIRYANCPVIAVKNKVDVDNIKNIILVTNCSQTPFYVTNELQDLTKILGARLQLLMVNTREEWKTHRDIEGKLNDFATLHRIEDYEVKVYDDDTVLEGIIHYSEDRRTDVLALMTHGRMGMSHLMNGSIAEKVAGYSPLPVWTCGFENSNQN